MAYQDLLLLLITLGTALAAGGDIKGFSLTDADGSHVLAQTNMRLRRLSLNQEQLHLKFNVGEVSVDVEVHKMQRSAFTDELKITSNGVTRTGVHVDVPTYGSKDRRVLLHFNHDGSAEALVTHKDLVGTYHVRSSSDGRSLESIDIPRDFYVGLTAHNGVVKTHPHTLHRKLAVTPWVGRGQCYEGDNVMKKLKIGIAIDSALYTLIGGTEEAALAYVNGIISKANEIYGPQLGMLIFVDGLHLQTSTDTLPRGANWNKGTDIDTRLSQLGLWEAPSEQAAWHLIGDIGFNGGTAGLASLGTICRVSKINYATPAYGNRGVNWHHAGVWATFAHELGHNCGASHSWEDGQGETGGIMDYGALEAKKIDDSWQFNTVYRKDQVCAVIQENMVNKQCDNRPDRFSAYKPECGNGVIEDGEMCECEAGETSCACCDDCQITAGKMCTPTSDGCCTSECMWSDHGAECDLIGEKGYCAKGACTSSGKVCPTLYNGGICNLDGCSHDCFNSNGECKDPSGYLVGDGSGSGSWAPAGTMKDGTYCETTDCYVGTCQSGQCQKDPNAAEHCAASPDVSIVNGNSGADISEYHPSNLPSTVPFESTGCAGFKGRFWDQESDISNGHYTGLGLLDCYEKCDSNDDCHSFDYENDDMTTKENGDCSLYSAAVSIDTLAYGPPSQAAAYVCSYHADSAVIQICDKTVETSIAGAADISGPDGQQSVDSCYAHCQDEPQCQWFTYDTADGTCSFYSFAFTSQQLETNYGSVNTYQCKIGGPNNVCTCENGVAATGASCPMDGWGMCVSCDEGATKKIYEEGSNAGHNYCELPPEGCVLDNAFNGVSCDEAFANGWSCNALVNVAGSDCSGCDSCGGGGGAGINGGAKIHDYSCTGGVAPDGLGCCSDGNCPWDTSSGGCKCYSQSTSTMTYTLSGKSWEEKTCTCERCADTCEGPAESVDGGYGRWSACSVDCGGGIQTRSCDSPPPSGGGADCAGGASQMCNTDACVVAINGGYGAWGACSVDCGGGVQTRMCNSPAPSGGGTYCTGTDSQMCNTRSCAVAPPAAVDGGYGPWGACSVDCGGGIKTRSCDSPASSNGGTDCAGAASMICNTGACAGTDGATTTGDSGPCDAQKKKKKKNQCLACQALDCTVGNKKQKKKCAFKVKKCKKKKFLA